MGKHAKTLTLVEAAWEILRAHNPMTVRQVFYQLVSGQVLENTHARYKAVCSALVDARKKGVIPWGWIEDRLRRPRHVAMWDGLADFAEAAVRSYRRDVWAEQDIHLEVWLEKDALSGIFEDILDVYGVTLNVGRGYDGWDSIRNAALRYEGGTDTTILYFGDFDPSGEDMARSLRERLAFFGCEPTLVKCALTAEDVARYRLPPAFTKRTDTRRTAFIEKFGDIAVELDALSIDVLRERLVAEVEARMDLDTLDSVRLFEKEERARLLTLLKNLE